MQHVCFLISISFFLNIHSCNIWIILQQLLILKLFWQNNATQDLTKEFAAAALSNQYIRVLGERQRNNPGNAFMRNFSAGGRSGLFFRTKKSLIFLPLSHLQPIILRLNHTSCQLITFSKQRLNFCRKSLSCGLDTDIGFKWFNSLGFF